MIPRYIKLDELTKHKSAFLFGPRSTGKSLWIHQTLPDCVYVDLLKSAHRRRYLADPALLAEVAAANPGALIVIDEIQLIPELLDEVHSLIEETDCRFLLTGSSARKLKRTGANMLGGRARKAHLYPLTWWELNNAKQFDLHRYLLYGGMPRTYMAEDPIEELSDYVDTYLDQEIKAEAISRNILGFERFFARAALCSGQEINYSNIASDAQLSAPTVRQYFEVLEDTLLGFYLTPWQGSRRKAIQRSKFYLFDVGVAHFLAQIDSLPKQSDLFGRAFESFIIQELLALCNYKRKRKNLYFWRTTHQDEVDLIIGDDIAIEIKASSKVTQKHCKGLMKIKDEGFTGKRVVVSLDPIKRKINEVELWPFEAFLEQMWTNY